VFESFYFFNFLFEMVRQGSKGSGKNAVAGSAVAGGQHDTDKDDAVGLLASTVNRVHSMPGMCVLPVLVRQLLLPQHLHEPN
jgi:hypothetical protein